MGQFPLLAFPSNLQTSDPIPDNPPPREFSSKEECKEEAARFPRHTNPRCKRAREGAYHLYLNHDLLTEPGTNEPQTFNSEEDGRQNIQWGIAGRPEETNPTLVPGREGIWYIYVIHQPTRQDHINEQTQPVDLRCKGKGKKSSRDYDNYEDIDCENYEIGSEGEHHVVSHQLHDETKRRRTVPDSLKSESESETVPDSSPETPTSSLDPCTIFGVAQSGPGCAFDIPDSGYDFNVLGKPSSTKTDVFLHIV